MGRLSCPILVLECLKKWFSYPQEMVHCQVATAAAGNPHIRTMGLYEITDEGALVFLTRNDTLKWHDLQQNPRAAVCMVNLEYGQVVVEGLVDLKTYRDPLVTLKYWNQMVPTIKKIYQPPANGEMSDSFGVLFIQPNSWEVLEIYKEDYCKSRRKQFLPDQGTWQERNLTPV